MTVRPYEYRSDHPLSWLLVGLTTCFVFYFFWDSFHDTSYNSSYFTCFYFLFTNAHVIADGLSSMMMMIKTFVNELCGVSSDRSIWEEHLALSVASDELHPAAQLMKVRW